MHLDIATDDSEAEMLRLEALVVSIVERSAKRLVMETPSWHRCCVFAPLRLDFDEKANVWE